MVQVLLLALLSVALLVDQHYDMIAYLVLIYVSFEHKIYKQWHLLLILTKFEV